MPTDPEKGKHLSQMTYQEIENIFNEIDLNHDGILSRRELARFLNKFALDHDVTAIDKILQGFNCQLQGYIRKSDFEAYVLTKYSFYKRTFEEFDHNHDGFITEAQVKEVLHRLGTDPDHLDEGVTRIMHSVKLSHDGRISFDEFINYFVLNPKILIERQFHFWGSFGAQEILDTDNLSETEMHSPVWVTLVAGTSAGIISRTTTAPLDRVKTLRQASLGQTVGLTEAFTRIVREDGVKALFRGNFTNCVKVVPQTVFRFATYDIAKEYICQDVSDPTFSERLLCGGLAGLISQTFVYPLEPVKTRLAICPTGTYNGMFDCMWKMHRHEGTRSLFKGISPALLGIVPYSAIDLCLFNWSKDSYQTQYDYEPSAVVLLACGSFSGLVAQTVTYPLSLVRTRLQAQGMPGTNQLFDGMWDCMRKTFTHEGTRGLFKGIVPNYLKAIPAGAIGFMAFEKTKLFILHNRQKSC